MIIFLYGQDTYRSYKHVTKLRERFRKEVDPTGSSIVSIEGRELDMAYLRKVVLAPSLFVKSRFVIFKDVITSKPTKQVQEDIVKILSEYATDDKSNILVFWESKSEKELKAQRAQKFLFDFLQKQKFAQEFKCLSQVQLRDWIVKKCKTRGCEINREALKTFLLLTGNDMWRIASELEKILAYRHGQSIRVEDIELLVAKVGEEDIYTLLDMIISGKTQDALMFLSKLLKSVDAEQAVFNTIKWHLNSIVSIKNAQFAGIVSDSDIAKLTNLHPYVVQKNKFFAQKISYPVLRRLVERVGSLEVELRQNYAPASLLITRFVFGLSLVVK